MKTKPFKFKPEYCQDLIDHMSKGLSYTTWGADHNVGTSTIYEWEEKIPEWKEAKEKAFKKCQEFFEKRLVAKISGQDIKGFDSRKVDTSCLIFALKTRFYKDYSEKQQIESTTKVEITIDDDESKL